jgi:Phage capsid family
MSSRPFPLPSDVKRAAFTSLVRAVLAHARASYTGDRNVANVVRRSWPRDEEALRIVTKAATAPARTDTAGWAAELSVNTISELLIALGPLSAGSELLRRGTVLTLDRYGSITVPALVASATNASFIGQGQAIPIRQLDTSKSVKLEPRKLATGFVLSREIIESGNAEALVRMVMTNSVALSLDGQLFSNVAGDSVKPPGLLFGIAALTPVTGGGLAAMTADLAALAAAVAPVGALDLVFVASPGEAVKILLNAGPKFNFPVLSSSALASKTVICVAPIAVVAAADATPEIQESRNAVVHMDTSPSDPIMAGQPVKSMFQTDSSAFRLIFDVDWGLLNPGGAAVVANVTW